MADTNGKDFYLTEEGIQQLKTEHQTLVQTKRPEIASRLKSARDQGDLSENAEWDDAKNEQSFIEGRIAEIEHILKHATVITHPATNSAVGIGSTVHLAQEDATRTFTIVGSTEANPGEGKISNESPIGKALIGKKKGEEIAIEVPSGTISYKITHIE